MRWTAAPGTTRLIGGLTLQGARLSLKVPFGVRERAAHPISATVALAVLMSQANAAATEMKASAMQLTHLVQALSSGGSVASAGAPGPRRRRRRPRIDVPVRANPPASSTGDSAPLEARPTQLSPAAALVAPTPDPATKKRAADSEPTGLVDTSTLLASKQRRPSSDCSPSSVPTGAFGGLNLSHRRPLMTAAPVAIAATAVTTAMIMAVAAQLAVPTITPTALASAPTTADMAVDADAEGDDDFLLDTLLPWECCSCGQGNSALQAACCKCGMLHLDVLAAEEEEEEGTHGGLATSKALQAAAPRSERGLAVSVGSGDAPEYWVVQESLWHHLQSMPARDRASMDGPGSAASSAAGEASPANRAALAAATLAATSAVSSTSAGTPVTGYAAASSGPTSAYSSAGSPPRARAATSDGEEDAPWPCPTCTFLNPAFALTCDMCGATALLLGEDEPGDEFGRSRSPPAAVPTAAKPPGGAWRCVMCTLVNALAAQRCAVCGCEQPLEPDLVPLDETSAPALADLAAHAPRSTASSALEPPPQAGSAPTLLRSDWRCAHCTFVNAHSAAQCEICGHLKTL